MGPCLISKPALRFLSSLTNTSIFEQRHEVDIAAWMIKVRPGHEDDSFLDVTSEGRQLLLDDVGAFKGLAAVESKSLDRSNALDLSSREPGFRI